ncbi:MAG TPA: phenylalanine--tRNA ligase subunit alpha [Candidatus Poseidoniales archaeon]|nr:phenylalanine--tRNA ligase subunit alpha [Candidatus Poseidoniales archaeon]HIL67343.1 phenylalanine--tRNA ligase subunit alpha [Candidatus Poseidoniales archaeon]
MTSGMPGEAGMNLRNNERRMLKGMLSEPNSEWSLEKLLSVAEWDDQVHVAGAGKGLQEAGMVEITETTSRMVSLGAEGKRAADYGLLESRLWHWIRNKEEVQRTMSSLMSSNFDRSETGPGIGILKGLGVEIDSGNLVFLNEEEISREIDKRAEFIKSLSNGPIESSSADEEMISHFSSRSGLLEFEENTSRTWKLTKAGASIDQSALTESQLIGELTPEMLQTGSWVGGEFKPFDVQAPAPTPIGGRRHPMQSLIERIRSVFLEMGFSEIDGDYVQSAGWNMDSLFIPQSHPARTMQDTFYLDKPSKVEVEGSYLDLWARVHEHGHDTGSKGWGGSFDIDESQRALLRTHTTVNTVRHIAENPSIPSRVFGIGRVFRQETIDRTHMPEFHQIEGIIHEPDASLPMLISTLKTFYAKMGYPDVRVRPAYFPYTEPSAEVDILWKGEWLELGGSGIFRPEVTEPLGTEWPVCAWGMGLERLAMLILGLDDIRQLYQPDLERLRKMPLL